MKRALPTESRTGNGGGHGKILLLAAVCGISASCLPARASSIEEEAAENSRRIADLEAYRELVEADSAPPAAACRGRGCAELRQTAVGGPSSTCGEGEHLWLRAAGIEICATACRSDIDCVGFATGDERCRLVSSNEDAGNVFVDEETAEALDLADAEQLEATAVPEDEVVFSDSGDAMIYVTPECESASCQPILVPAPVPALSVRLCDVFWDLGPPVVDSEL